MNKNYKDIVNHFDIITSVISDNKKVIVEGYDKDSNFINLVTSYNHKKIAQKVKTLVKMFLDIK